VPVTLGVDEPLSYSFNVALYDLTLLQASPNSLRNALVSTLLPELEPLVVAAALAATTAVAADVAAAVAALVAAAVAALVAATDAAAVAAEVAATVPLVAVVAALVVAGVVAAAVVAIAAAVVWPTLALVAVDLVDDPPQALSAIAAARAQGRMSCRALGSGMVGRRIVCPLQSLLSKI
jgi:hypothetical protein